MFKKSNRGFTLIELLTVMGIMAVLGGVAMSNYFSYQSSVNIDGAANELLGTLRDAQQRAISQDSQAAWGVNITAPADSADYYELFSGPNYSSGAVISRTTLSSDLYFLLPAQGSSKEIDFAKSTGLPNGNYTITIASQRNSSLFRTITINTTTGLVTLESGLSGVPTIVSITPTTALNFSPINITALSGVNFLSGATFKLSKTGQSDVNCTNVVFVNSQDLTGTCDITGIATGAWDVVVTNPDSQVATLPGAFSITNSSTPGVPTLTSAYPSGQQTTLNWQAPTSDGGSSITHYEIYRSTSSGGETFLAETGNVLTYTDTGLTTGSTYYYKVSAKNINGEGNLSNELSAFIGSARIFVTSTTYNGNLGGLSGASSLCAARAAAVGLTGTWKAWLSDGTANASSTLYHGTVPYINMHGDKVANNWTGLTSGTLLAPIKYNESGTITAGQAWTGSYSDGTSYFTQNCVNWTSSTGTGGDAGLSGLVSSTGSQWSFLGTNSCNTSLPLYCIEQLTPPSAPLNLTATPSTSNIVLNWQAPASNGGSSITNYKIYRGISSGSETYYDQVSGSTLTYTDSVVSGGTTYYYKVTAINLSLESQYSNETSGSLIVLTVPSQPQNLIVSGGDLSSTLTWQAPSSNGNSSITNYKVYRGSTSGSETLLTSGGCSGLGNVLTCADSSLTNGSTYYYKVSAVNSVGEGSLSNEFYQITWDRTATYAWGYNGRQESPTVNFNGKLYTMGGLGMNYPASYLNDVWYSTDGANWTQGTNAGWSIRTGHSALVFNNKIWVMGGQSGTTGNFLNDVWYSTDGTTWTQATAAAAWSARGYFTATVYNGKMWIMGGYGSGGPISPYNDVWYSTDGTTWTQATAAAAWSVRWGLSSVVYGGKMWVIGGAGSTGPGYKNDAWYSTDGITWTAATTSAAWSGRMQFISAIYNNAIWVLNGIGSNYDTGIWSSNDGVTWMQAASSSIALGFRYADSSAIFNNKLWIVGGNATTGPLPDVWNIQTSVTPPSAPVLSVVADNQQVTLSWTAPSNGGSDITGYKIYRGTTSGGETFLTEIGNVLTYTDTGLTNGTPYYYKASAINSNGEGSLSAEAIGYPGAKRVFVTSTTYNGNLGGLSGADAKCQARADAVGLGGTWKAWLSNETTDASSRLGHSTSPYINMHGSIVANNWTDLTDGALSASIQYNESGVAVAGQAWTGSYADGTHYFSQDCTAWTSTAGTGGDAGLSGIVTSTTGTWSNNGTNSCVTSLPLYCVEQ